jgi:NADPH:quinone reductase-like Zn-dependent oxidoreductase
MKAVVYSEYGSPDVLHLAEVERPVPKPNELLIRTHATTVTAGDIRARAFDVPFWQWLPARIYLGMIKPKRNILN